MDFDSFREKASLLTLPIETRFMIYDLVIKCTGTLVVYAQYELTSNADPQTIQLLHVNRLIRAEVHEYFYKNHNFQFRSFPAVEKFLDKIGPYYAGIIKSVVIGSWLAQRAQFAEQVTPLLEKLTGIERLTIQAPAHGFVTEWSHQAELGDKAIAVINASKRLGAGKLCLAWVCAYNKSVMQFLAPGIPHPSQDDRSFHNLLRGLYGQKWYHWQIVGIVHFVEVKISEDLLGSTDTQEPKSEGKIETDESSILRHLNNYVDDEDDPDL